MEKQIEEFAMQTKKQGQPDIRPGDTVKVYQKYKDNDKEKIQIFEGLVLARKHGNEAGATITVRKIASGVGVEKIFPLHSPMIDKIEVVRQSKVRRSKLNYLRTAKGKRSQLKIISAKKTK
jgi:large subunit ribosomal protein L19